MRGGALPLLLLIAAAVAPAPWGGAAQSELGSWTRQDGQWLADKCAEFGERNENMTVQLPASTVVELRNATFTHANSSSVPGLKPYARGVLRISGAGEYSSIIDMGMRADMLPLLVTAEAYIEDVGFINGCWVRSQLTTDFPIATPALLGLFGMTVTTQTVTDNRTTNWLPQSTVAWVGYGALAATTRLSAVRASYGTRMDAFLPLLNLYRLDVGPFDVTVITGAAPRQHNNRRVWRSLDTPGDPVLAFARQEGLLMEQRWCGNGSLVDPARANSPVSNEWGPLWTATTREAAVQGLGNAVRAAPAQMAAKWPIPGVMFFLRSLDLAEASLPGSGQLVLTAPLLLHGPVMGVWARRPPPVLDLTARGGALFSVAGVGHVSVGALTLRLPALPPPSAMATAPTSALTFSALVATAGAAAATASSSGSSGGGGGGSMVAELFNVTLEVPTQDFLALLTLVSEASGGGGSGAAATPCADNATLALAAQLKPGFYSLAASNATWEGLRLDAFSAWGVNGTAVAVRPQAPVPATVAAQCGGLVAPGGAAAAPAATGEGEGDDESSVPLGVIIGCSVGGVALLLAVAGGAVVLLRRRKRQRKAGDRLLDSPHDAQNGAKALPRVSPPASPGGHTAAPGGTPATADCQSWEHDALAVAVVAREAPSVDDLVAFLEGQEMRLMRQVVLSHNDSSEALVGSALSVGVGGGAAPTLHHVHEQLMSVVAHRQQQQQQNQRQRLQDAGGVTASRSNSGAPAVALVLTGDGRSTDSGPALPREGAVLALGAQGSGSLDGAQRGVLDAASRMRSHQGSDADTVVVDKVLGRGGSGIVYTGTWRGLPVAVKTVIFEAWTGGDDAAVGAAGGRASPAPSKTQMRYVRAIMETAISASVGHPNVVATYHYDIKRMDDQRADGRGSLQVIGGDLDVTMPMAPPSGIQAFKAFLVQELCTCSLRTVLERWCLPSATSDKAVSAGILHHVALGLQYLHSKGIIHGDLTPGNILLKLDKGVEPVALVAKLADFGLSSRLDGQATHVSGFNAGTPFYVAPEVARLQRTSPASDIFSFGVVAWEMYSGRQPFLHTAQGAFQRNPLFPSYSDKRRPPAEVEALITMCLAPEPRQRPSAAELVAAFASHAVGA